MAWPTSTALVSGQTAGVSTTFNAVRADLAATNGYVLKTADESVTSSTALQNDDHLFYSINSAGSYVFDLWLYGTSAANAAGDLLVSMTFPTGTCHWGSHVLDPALASSVIASMAAIGYAPATSGSSSAGIGLSTTGTMAWIHGILIATGTGTLRLQWAQNSSNANASTLKTGSHMLVRQVA